MRSASSRPGRVLSLEESLDALVDEPQAGLHPQDGLPHHPEAEVPRLDEAGVHRADGDLVDAGALDRDEGERARVVDHRWRGAGVVAHRVPALRPVLVQDQAPRLGVAHGHDAEEVGELALEAAGRKRQRRPGRAPRAGPGRAARGARCGGPAGREVKR